MIVPIALDEPTGFASTACLVYNNPLQNRQRKHLRIISESDNHPRVLIIYSARCNDRPCFR